MASILESFRAKSKPVHDGEPFSGLNLVSLRITPASVTLRNMIENSQTQGEAHRVELNLRDVNQLFNTIDPSPFREKDLDRDAEEFIVSWTREFPLREPVVLVIYLSELPVGKDIEPMIEQSVQNYFAYRARIIHMEFRQLMKDGRHSLLIGGLFLAACLTASHVLVGRASGTFLSVARESLTIAGWVAMWRPMEIFLYEWWPLRRRGRVFEKMSHMKVEVRKRG
jgi:hypothetical protein